MIHLGVTATNDITRKYMDSIWVEERLIDSGKAAINTTFFGKEYQSPIMTPAFSHLKSYGEGRASGMVEYATVCKNLGLLNWVGMAENAWMDEVFEVGVDTVRIIKPYADREKLLDQIRYSEEHGAVAVGVDIDHIFGNDGDYDLVVGERMNKVTQEDLRTFVGTTKLPFIIKGVLSVKDAVKCAENGVKGIVVSHHSGRMPFAVPPLMVLPEIKKALEGSGVTIFVDCHIDSGVDAFKALALGADGVSVGRAMWPALQEGGVPALTDFITKMNRELAFMMDFTGAATIKDIDLTVLHNL